MKASLVILALLLVTASLPAQSAFPTAWTGTYAGEMKIGNVGQPTALVPVTFELKELLADSLWSHKMVFDSEQYGKITKDYLLRAASKGDTVSFILDEQNGIVMDQTLLNDCFYGMYTVLGNTYVATLRRLPDGTLLWDLFAAPQSSRKVSEADAGGAEPIEVEGLRVSLQQTVFLHRE